MFLKSRKHFSVRFETLAVNQSHCDFVFGHISESILLMFLSRLMTAKMLGQYLKPSARKLVGYFLCSTLFFIINAMGVVFKNYRAFCHCAS